MDWGTIGFILFAMLMLFCCGGMMMGMHGKSHHKEPEKKKPTADREQI